MKNCYCVLLFLLFSFYCQCMAGIAPRLWKIISPVRLHAIRNCCGCPAVPPLVAEYGSTLRRSMNTAEFMRVTILTTAVVYIITVHQLQAVSLLLDKIEVVLIPAVPSDLFLLFALLFWLLFSRNYSGCWVVYLLCYDCQSYEDRSSLFSENYQCDSWSKVRCFSENIFEALCQIIVRFKVER